ncbi:hypothetical protein CHUAL_002706 [Chamberlinius hualienensis]
MEQNGQRAIAISTAVVGAIGLILAILFFLRYSNRKKKLNISSEKEAVIEIKSVESKLPISLTSIPTQMDINPSKSKSKFHIYPRSTFYPDPLKLTPIKDNVDVDEENKDTIKIFLKKKGKSYETLVNELKTEKSQQISKEEISQQKIPENISAGGDESPECLPEQWSTPTYTTTMEFQVTYVTASNILAIHVTKLKNLPNWKPFKSTNNHRIKIKLRHLIDHPYPHLTPPTSTQDSTQEENKKIKTLKKNWSSHSSLLNSASTSGQTVKKDFDFENGAILAFSGLELPELKNFYLLILLYELKYKSLREKLIGECVCPLAQLELGPNVSVTCMENVRLKKKESSSLDKKSRGQLLISLFYQTEANRMKVLVRKASDLPKMKLPGLVTEYGVIVNSIFGGTMLTSQETKKIHGRSPVWNQPFIFDIPQKKLDKYSLQFITYISVGMNQPHQTIGHVIIGPDVKGSGHEHWNEAIKPKSLESTFWHKLQPIQ